MGATLVDVLARPSVILVAGLVAVVGLLGLAGVLLKRRDEARLRAATPVVPENAPDMGYALLTGGATPGDGGPTTSPVTGREVVGYRYRVRERLGDDDWRAVTDGGEIPPFELAGREERLAVATESVPPMVDEGWEAVTVPAGEAPPNELRERFEAADIAAAGILDSVDADRRFEESVIEPGDSVFVYGLIRGDDDEHRIAVDPQQEYTVGTVDPATVELDAVGEGSGIRFYLLLFGVLAVASGAILLIGLWGWLAVVVPVADVFEAARP